MVAIQGVAHKFLAWAESLSHEEGKRHPNGHRVRGEDVETHCQAGWSHHPRGLAERVDRHLGTLVGHPRLAREPRVRT